MNNRSLLIVLGLFVIATTSGQNPISTNAPEQEISTLIDTYSLARTEKDSIRLQAILTDDVDQLVSSGIWRKGKSVALMGMLQSSETNPGARSLNIDQIRFLSKDCAIVDARYRIQNTDGTERNMWSTFIVVYDDSNWKIAAIRNMLPQANNK
ncbi:MAG: SgcJ/EcaC family oxidoreductase [Maribacter sp.]|nr:SgcJ/EcaC family oxidoreductase [Maribacter sp.]